MRYVILCLPLMQLNYVQVFYQDKSIAGSVSRVFRLTSRFLTTKTRLPEYLYGGYALAGMLDCMKIVERNLFRFMNMLNHL